MSDATKRPMLKPGSRPANSAGGLKHQLTADITDSFGSLAGQDHWASYAQHDKKDKLPREQMSRSSLNSMKLAHQVSEMSLAERMAAIHGAPVTSESAAHLLTDDSHGA